MITQDQLKDVLDRADALYKYLKIDEKKMEYEEEDLRTQAPDFWEDQKRAEEQMKKVKGIKKWLDGYQAVRTAADELQLAFDFYKEEMVTEQEVDTNYRHAIETIEALELKVLLGYGVTDIARLYGTKANLVGAWMSKAVKQIRKDLTYAELETLGVENKPKAA